jgi:hypothetical protein
LVLHFVEASASRCQALCAPCQGVGLQRV